MTTDETLDALAKILEGSRDVPCVSGSFVPDAPIAIGVDASGAVPIVRSKTDAAQGDALASLFALLTPATFGKGQRTVRDDRVRRALHRYARDGLHVVGFDPATSGVLDHIREEMCSGDQVEAELYAVQVYPAGGHFQAHKDTPRGVNMLGTLVVCLPTRFSGGVLEIDRGPNVQLLDWGTAIADQAEPTRVHWTAFFGDVDHAITEVTSGCRVTLTYLLRHVESEDAAAPSARGEALREILSAATASPTFATDGGAIVFGCLHLYGFDRLYREPRSITERTLGLLKGRDRDIAAATLACGLEIALWPCLRVEETGFPDSTADLRGTFLARLEHIPTEREVDALRGESGLPEIDEDALEAFYPNERATYVVPLRSSAENARHFLHCMFSGTGYFGNEGGEADLYLFAALVVSVLPARERLDRGRRVVHAKFGEGVVVGGETRGEARALRIRFADGERVVLERFVRDAPR